VLVVHLDHQSVEWLAELLGPRQGVFEPAEEFVDPTTGRRVRASRAWSYEPATQTAVVVTRWEELGDDGEVIGHWERGPIRLHCVFRFEMHHLLARAGLEIEAVYGDFLGGELRDDSEQMVWVAHRRKHEGHQREHEREHEGHGREHEGHETEHEGHGREHEGHEREHEGHEREHEGHERHGGRGLSSARVRHRRETQDEA
jgi:hypothetical protein